MNILVINWRDIKHPRAGGAEVRLHHVYEPMVARGHRVVLITSQFSGCESNEVINGLEVHRVGSDRSFAAIVFFSLRSWVKKFNIDIVVEDFNKLPFLTPLISPVPVLIQMHHLWLASIFKETAFPAAFTVWLGEQLIRPFYRRKQFCVVSESTKSELATYGVPKDRIEIVYNGVDLEFYHPPLARCEGKPYLFWLGRIQKYKGVLDCCESFRLIADEYPDLSLKIAGNGPYRAELEKWIDTHGLQDRIEMLGFISEEEKLSYLQDAFAVVQSSYKEGWGLTVIEANACGTMVVANNAPGLCDSVRDNETGLLYKFGSVDSMAEKFRSILDDGDLYRRLSGNCRSWAERFDWTTPSDQTELLLKTVLKQ